MRDLFLHRLEPALVLQEEQFSQIGKRFHRCGRGGTGVSRPGVFYSPAVLTGDEKCPEIYSIQFSQTKWRLSMPDKIDLLDYVKSLKNEGSFALEAVRLDGNQVALVPFTTDSESVIVAP